VKRLSALGSWLSAVLLMGAAAVDYPLIDAARSTDREAIRRLVQEKVDVNAAEPDGTTALHWASYRDDGESADLLIKAGANVNAANDLGATPLWTASLNGSATMVRRLLQAGANPNAALLLGETPLMVASRSGNPDVVEQLLARERTSTRVPPEGKRRSCGPSHRHIRMS
jgi:ankyrin repeat protein